MNCYFILIMLLFIGRIEAQWYPQTINVTGYFEVVHFENENVGWMCSNNPSKIYKTTNGGNTWFLQFETDGPIISIFFLDENYGWFTDMDSNGGRLNFTSDGGYTWIQRYPADYYFFHELHFFDLLNGIAVGSGRPAPGWPQVGAMFKTSDGGTTWDVFFNQVFLYSVYFLDDSNGWCGGDLLFKTTDSGQNWSSLPNTFDDYITKIKFFNESTGYLSVYSSNNYKQLYSTNNAGYSWDLMVALVNDFWFIDVNTGWYIIDDKIFHTTDAGENWHLQYSSTGNDLLSVYFFNPDLGWAAGYDGYILNTINGGTPVELVSFIVDTEGSNVILNWATATELNNSGFDIERSTNKNDWIKIGFKEGKGTTTEQQNYNFTDDLFGVNSLKLYYRLKQIDYDGQFEYSNVLEVEVTPLTFALYQNYPNPFNPSTVISYQLPVSGDITLKVFDVLGREVATLVDEYRDAGYHEVEFNPASGIGNLPAGRQGLASGIYFYQLQAGSFIETKKMVVIR